MVKSCSKNFGRLMKMKEKKRKTVKAAGKYMVGRQRLFY